VLVKTRARIAAARFEFAPADRQKDYQSAWQSRTGVLAPHPARSFESSAKTVEKGVLGFLEGAFGFQELLDRLTSLSHGAFESSPADR
jgi:hypothetical protein